VLDGTPAFLTKLDQSGGTVFSNGYSSFDDDGTPLNANVAGVAFDGEDNMLVIGTFTAGIDLGGGFSLKASYQAVLVAKYDAPGKIVWGMTPGGGLALDGSSGISADPLGGVVVTGVYGSGMDFGGGILYGNPGQQEMFLARLAP
jgi:hypothetical protein